MRLPFTVDEFLGVFADYNLRFGIGALALWLVTIAIVVLAWRQPSRYSRPLFWFLGLLWLWNGLVYHALLFTSINPAAWLFAALFVAEGILLLSAGHRLSIAVAATNRWRSLAGWSLVTYALAYPVLNLTLGHPYPGTPTFGVPCPTAILTIGVLVVARGASVIRLAIVPCLWGLVGGSAALMLGVWTDYVLLAAGVVLVATLVGHAARRPPSRGLSP